MTSNKTKRLVFCDAHISSLKWDLADIEKIKQTWAATNGLSEVRNALASAISAPASNKCDSRLDTHLPKKSNKKNQKKKWEEPQLSISFPPDIYITQPAIPQIDLRFHGKADIELIEKLKEPVGGVDADVFHGKRRFEYFFHIKNTNGVTARDLHEALETAFAAKYNRLQGWERKWRFRLEKIEILRVMMGPSRI